MNCTNDVVNAWGGGVAGLARGKRIAADTITTAAGQIKDTFESSNLNPLQKASRATRQALVAAHSSIACGAKSVALGVNLGWSENDFQKFCSAPKNSAGSSAAPKTWLESANWRGVAVVGAGLGGVALAALLSRQGD